MLRVNTGTAIEAPQAAVNTDTVVDRICMIGTSLIPGGSATTDDATGPREAFFQELRRHRSLFTFVGPHGDGALNGTGTTYGRFYPPEQYQDHSLPPPLGSFAHHGEPGRKMSATFAVTNVNTGTNKITAPGHDLGNGSLLALSSTGTMPGNVSATRWYFAANVSGDTLELSELEVGTSVDITSEGTGTITLGTGLAQLIAVTLPILNPKKTISWIGTNDASALVDASDPDALATMQARAVLYFDNLAAGAPNADLHMVWSIPSFYSPASNAATKQALVASFNAWLSTYVQSRGSKWAFVDVAAELTAAHAQSDGIHLLRSANRTVGEIGARALMLATGGRLRGQPVPRAPKQRASQPVLNFTATTNNVTIPDQASIRVAGDNCMYSVWYCPSSLPAGPNVILQQNFTYTDGFLLAQSNANILLYWRQGGPSMPASPYNAVLRVGEWTRISFVVDHAADKIAAFANGRHMQTVNITDSNITVQQSLYIGAQGGLNAALGQCQMVTIARGSRLTVENALELAERDYYDAEHPDEAISFPLNEGTGTSVAGSVPGSTAGTVTGASWLAAGAYPRRCVEDGALSPWRLIEFGAAAASPTIRQADDAAASSAADTMLIAAQSKTGATSTGDHLTLASGGGTSADGALTLRVGGSTIRIQANSTGLGLFGVTPVARPAAYTQTYSTATRTLGAYTPDAESGAYSGIDNAQVGTVYATVADLNALRVAYENLRAFVENVAGVLNSSLDDDQAIGLKQ